MKKTVLILAILCLSWWVISSLIALLKVQSIGQGACEDRMLRSHLFTEHQRSWQFISNADNYCLSFRTKMEGHALSEEYRKATISRLSHPEDPWSELYRDFSARDEQILFLVDSFRTIADSQQLSGIDLAELVLTFVQDIPYSYVIPGDCADRETGDNPCVGNVELGLFTPYEFLHTERGDCDTRSVLIFAVLERLGFDPAILISDEYAHAMIALNIPTAGDFVIYQGKKYYFWETTAKGWMAGMLPPSYGNKNYWKIALANEY